MPIEKRVNNPAGRLLRFLRDAKNRKELLQKPANQALADLLCGNVKEPAKLLREVGNIAQLPYDITRAVRALQGIDPDNLIQWVPKFIDPWLNLSLRESFTNLM